MIRAAIVTLVCSSLLVSAYAADVPISGDRLRIAFGPRRVEVLSRDGSIAVTGGDPTVVGATFELYSATQVVSFPMPAGEWTTRMAGSRFRFASHEPKIKAVLESGRLLRVVVTKPNVFPLGGSQGSVAARFTVGGTRLCALFGGSIWKDDGQQFVARQAPAPASCPIAPGDICAGVACVAQDVCHDAGTCDPLTGVCSNPSKANGVACDDGIACTASSSCQGGICVSAAPTCRDESVQSDHGHCDLSTGACVADTDCPLYFTRPDGSVNKCGTTIGKDPATGVCLYRGTYCPARGCNVEACNPNSGTCEVVANNVLACGSTGNICVNLDSDGTPCDVSACSYEHCRRNPLQPQNCDRVDVRDCNDENPSTCQTASPCDAITGCTFTAVAPCAPPTDPCEELVMDGTASGCCTYRPKDCAGRFGNDPNFTYACNAGVCTATPR